MRLEVTVRGMQPINFPDAFKYSTFGGELDIYDGDVVIATFAKDEWRSIRRFKESDEEWPVEEPDGEDKEDSSDDEADVGSLAPLGGLTL